MPTVVSAYDVQITEEIMGRFGCLLMLLGTLALALIIVLPILLANNPSIDYLMERMLCNRAGDIYQSEPNDSPEAGPLTLNLRAYCVRSDNSRYEVTDTQTLYGLLGFAAPFLIGLLLFVPGIARNTARGSVVSVNVEALSEEARNRH
jgi:hypothetical protein